MPDPAARKWALLLLDLQDAVCREDGEVGQLGFGRQVFELGILDQAARSVDQARERGLFVAYSRLSFEEDYLTLTSQAPALSALREAGLLKADGAGVGICSEVAPAAGELVIEKTAIDPFVGTPLLPALLSRGVGHVALGGVATEHVVESAARHAADLGLHVTVLSDVCSSRTIELREHALRETLPFYASVTSSEDFFAGLS
jgi:nicotinamidase-related amidase